MTIHFYLNLKRPMQSEFPITCRITLNRKKTEFQLPFLTCSEICWDKPNEQAFPNAPMGLEINRQIQSYKLKAAELNYEYARQGSMLTLNNLKSHLQGKQKTHWNLLEFASHYLIKRKKIEGNRIVFTHIEITMCYVKEFLKKQGFQDIPIEQINKGWITDLHNFFKFYKFGNTDKQFAFSTIHKHLGKVKTILHDAVSNDLIAKNPFDGYRIPKPYLGNVPLTFAN